MIFNYELIKIIHQLRLLKNYINFFYEMDYFYIINKFLKIIPYLINIFKNLYIPILSVHTHYT